jgi:hypothetical protein
MHWIVGKLSLTWDGWIEKFSHYQDLSLTPAIGVNNSGVQMDYRVDKK